MTEVTAPSQKKQSVYDLSGEIDILELLAELWKGGWIIIGTALSITLATFLWLNSQPSLYKVTAELQAPSSYQLVKLQPSTLGNQPNNPHQLDTIKARDIFQQGFNQLVTLTFKKSFWQEQHKLTVDLKDPTSDNFQVFSNFLNNLSITLADKDKDTIKISLEALNPGEGVKTLEEFIVFSNTMVLKKQIVELTDGLKATLQAVNEDINFTRQHEVVRIKDRLVQLQEAKDIATLLEIEDTPYKQVSGVDLKIMDNRLYMLGSKALEAEIGKMSSRENIEAFSKTLRTMNLWKQRIEADIERINKSEGSTNIFQLALPPESTLSPIKPRRFLVLAMGIVIGGLLGIFIVLINYGVTSYKNRNRAA